MLKELWTDACVHADNSLKKIYNVVRGTKIGIVTEFYHKSNLNSYDIMACNPKVLKSIKFFHPKTGK